MRALLHLILPIYLPMVLFATAIFAILPGLPGYLTQIGAAVGLVGLILALRGGGTLLVDLPGGLLLARVGSRRIMSLAAAVLVGVGIVLATVPLLVVAAFCVLLIGGMSALFILGLQSHVRASMPPDLRGRALSSVGGSMRIGALAGPAIGGAVTDAFNMSATFLLFAVFIAAASTFVMIFLPAPRDSGPVRSGGAAEAAEAAEAKPRFATIGRLITHPVPGMYAVGGALVALMLLRASRSIILPLWGESIGLSVSRIGLVMSGAALFDLLLFIPAGLIMDRAGRKVAGAICMGVFTLGLALIPLTGSVVGFVMAAAVIGIGNGFGAGINLTMGADLAPDDQTGPFLGLWRLFGDIGSTAGPSLVGLVAAAVSLPVAVGAVAAVGVAGTAVMVFVAPETSRIAEHRRALEH
ncbi:MAG: MFS transporter [Spirochaetaceae bacterium]